MGTVPSSSSRSDELRGAWSWERHIGGDAGAREASSTAPVYAQSSHTPSAWLAGWRRHREGPHAAVTYRGHTHLPVGCVYMSTLTLREGKSCIRWGTGGLGAGAWDSRSRPACTGGAAAPRTAQPHMESSPCVLRLQRPNQPHPNKVRDLLANAVLELVGVGQRVRPRPAQRLRHQGQRAPGHLGPGQL